MKTAVVTTVLLLAVLLVAGMALIYSGRYSVAAAEPHAGVERWALETVKRSSVSRGAGGIAVPALDAGERVAAGASAYAEMCATCHGAPGVERSAMGRGLNPLPPAPDDLVRRWTPAELFWITKHGIRMTGMPAWGQTHTDDQIWEVVAFLRRLPGMTPEEYARSVDEAPDHDHERGASGHVHKWTHAAEARWLNDRRVPRLTREPDRVRALPRGVRAADPATRRAEDQGLGPGGASLGEYRRLQTFAAGAERRTRFFDVAIDSRSIRRAASPRCETVQRGPAPAARADGRVWPVAILAAARKDSGKSTTS